MFLFTTCFDVVIHCLTCCRKNFVKKNFFVFHFRRYEVGSEDYKIDGTEWYHYFLCGYKVQCNIIPWITLELQ
jgi:hypothetical protein